MTGILKNFQLAMKNVFLRIKSSVQQLLLHSVV